MRVLLDSHVALWWLEGSPRLGTVCAGQLASADQAVLSVVTPWELGIKRAMGKLDFPDDLVGAMVAEGFDVLPVLPAHAQLAPKLPPHHRDPFDRMLVAQANVEGLVLVSADRALRPYDVELLDAAI
jgi:PIN domain nuclease of toxin-antitoxin system